MSKNRRKRRVLVDLSNPFAGNGVGSLPSVDLGSGKNCRKGKEDAQERLHVEKLETMQGAGSEEVGEA